MKILAIETSTMLGGVAVADDRNGLVAETRLNVKTTHSEKLMTAVHNTLQQAETGMREIDAFAIAIGPGSFTGLRIGLGTVKGLSYSTGKPVVAVPTLDAFAWNFPFSMYPVCLMLDARKKEVYTALFQWRMHGFEKIMEETSIRPAELLKELRGSIIFAGEGALLYEDLILNAMGERAVMSPEDKMVPSPSNVAMLGLSKAIKGEYADVSATVPLYIRKSEAEVKWLERR